MEGKGRGRRVLVRLLVIKNVVELEVANLLYKLDNLSLNLLLSSSEESVSLWRILFHKDLGFETISFIAVQTRGSNNRPKHG